MTSQQIAALIDHSILHPTATDKDLEEQCQIAAKYSVATVCVKPYHVKGAKTLLHGSNVGICAVIGFPHGNSTTEIKVLETIQVCKDGATEVDMVVNIGKVLQSDWSYVSHEIELINNECIKRNAVLKVIFENDFLANDVFKIELCKICNQHKVAFIKTSTGYGFIKDNSGKYFYNGATIHDLNLMRQYADVSVQIKAAGGIRTLDELLYALEAGASRIGASATVNIVEEAKKRFGV